MRSDFELKSATQNIDTPQMIRVLHLGNIANNGYNNAKILRRHGIDSDVLCYGYYHIMGSVEWEEEDVFGTWGNDDFPAWKNAGVKKDVRPLWFAQGPFCLAALYLSARAKKQRFRSSVFRMLLNGFARFGVPLLGVVIGGRGWVGRALRSALRFGRNLFRFVRQQAMLSALSLTIVAMLAGLGVICLAKVRPDMTTPLAIGGGMLLLIFLCTRWWQHSLHTRILRRIGSLTATFKELFPHRESFLSSNDLRLGRIEEMLWSQLFSCYDLVIGYATEGKYPLVFSKPYLAFEHGTIRDLPFQESPQGRCCAITYRMADGVIITNCDNIRAAKQLRLNSYSFLPHPINEDHMDEPYEDLRAELLQALSADFIAFHPSRQHWEECRHPDWEKGNDIFIRGFAKFVTEHHPAAGAVFVDWGKTVEQSKELLESLGIADRVLWIPPQPNRSMTRYIRAADMVADQFFLGAFGGILPKALLHGCPTMLKLDEEIHRWCFPEMPPVMNVSTPEEVYMALVKLDDDTVYRDSLVSGGRVWYDAYHSNKVIAKGLTEMIANVTKRCRERINESA
ncbi:MAG: glycosyltransferase [Planctomycetes bacterium]|nr:glycosyltransferase [Planctomycetota bacterium]